MNVLCWVIGLAFRSKNFFKEKVSVLSSIAKGAKDGADWHDGLPDAKGVTGKPRTWPQYSNHGAMTIRVFPPIGAMDETINDADKAPAAYH